MAANRIESPKPEGGAAPAAAAGGAAAAAPAAGKSGIMAWMPVIANLVLMPVLAYVTTVYLIAPKLKPAAEAEDGAEEGAAAAHGKPAGKESAKDAGKEHGKAAPKESSKEHGKSSGGHGESKGGKGAKASVALSKSILVNVMGSMGTRYIMGSFTLVGSGADFEGKVKENDAQLRDAAAGVMSSKTLQDLEKPGARNLVRTELITVFNSILGGKVQDIFMTEFAVQ